MVLLLPLIQMRRCRSLPPPPPPPLEQEYKCQPLFNELFGGDLGSQSLLVLRRLPGFSLWNSCPKDDGLEHLSAEEKACLLFLEETIESLDNEEDGTLSNDEPDHLSNPSKVANELNGLLASASKLKGKFICSSG